MRTFFSNKKILMSSIVLVALFIGIGIWVGTYLVNKPSGLPRGVTVKGVSGIFNINGVIPPGSTVTLFQRPANTKGSFVPFATGIAATDQVFWSFSSGKTGKAYEIQAGLVQNGKVLYLTSPIFSTAPAINQVLTFNVPSTKPAGNAVISGNIGVNGYIPPGATLSLQGRKAGSGKFAIVTSNLPAKDEQFITYSSAIAGQAYEVQGLLLAADGQIIGSSEILSIVAPATNEELSINSIAVPPVTPTPLPTSTPIPTPTPQGATVALPTQTPIPTPVPAPQSVISGTIQFQGQAPPNSRIVIFAKPNGTANYQLAVDNIDPYNGTSWQWNAPSSGQWYNMIAILKQHQSNGTDTDISDSSVQTIAAPAANESFTINSGFSLPTPPTNITATCGNYNPSTQMWNVTISVTSVPNAQSYWYEIGTTPGSINLAIFTQNASSTPQQTFTNQQILNVTTYYVRYAYGTVPNLGAYDPQFSPFSSSFAFQCPQ